jgi:hypothetical protein
MKTDPFRPQGGCIAFLGDAASEIVGGRMDPVELHTQEPLSFTQKIYFKFLGQGILEVLFHVIVETEEDKIVHI